jgi:hypothetical protein
MGDHLLDQKFYEETQFGQGSSHPGLMERFSRDLGVSHDTVEVAIRNLEKLDCVQPNGPVAHPLKPYNLVAFGRAVMRAVSE